MNTIAFYAFVILFGWYLAGEVFGEQSYPESNSNVHTAAYIEAPELTKERIDLLKRIAGASNEDKFTSASTTVVSSDTDNVPTSFNDIVTIPAGSRSVKSERVRTNSSEWESYNTTNEYSGTKEGSASSAWTILSPSLNWTDDSIQATLTASCNDEGEKTLSLRMLSTYPISDAGTVKGLIRWDSSNPYEAPFVYDPELNALRLQFGFEDSLSLIRDGNNVTIQIPWYDDHQAVFEFSLKGSSRAVNTAFDYCAQ